MMNIKIKFNDLTLYFLLIALLCGYIKNALIVLGIILFHELGHVMIALILGYKIKCIEIFPFGGITKIDKLLNTKIYKDLLIASFGIVFQCLIFLFFKDEMIINYNRSIMIFNLLPIIPLDGSKIVFEMLNYKCSYKKTLFIYSIISFVFILGYLIFNYQYKLNNYMIIILFVCKTIECLRQRNVVYHKFLLERFLYVPEYSKVANNNQSINKYQKGIKYYYFDNGKIMEEKEYLATIYRN